MNSKYCVKCGSCVGVCPVSHFKLEYLSCCEYSIKETPNKCIECGKCTDICPIGFNQINFDQVNHEIKTYLLGNVIEIYKAYAADSLLRYRATSGGLISSILLELFNNHTIDSAFLVKFDKNNNTCAVPFFGSNEKDVLDSIGSKYQQVPLNILLKKVQNYNNVAVVGLPCHINALNNLLLKDAVLARKIKMRLGLMCSHTMTFSSIELIAKKNKIYNIDRIAYRGEGWPGKLKIYPRDQRQNVFVDVNSVWQDFFRTYLFAPLHCLYCNDHMNEKCDISFGDAWLGEELNDETNNGKSLVVVRTKTGQHLIEMVKRSNKVVTEPCLESQLIKSQLWPLYFKKKRIIAFLTFCKPKLKYGKKQLNFKITFIDYFIAFWTYCNAKLSNLKFFNRVIKIIPLKFFAMHRKIFLKVLGKATKVFYREIQDEKNTN